MLQNDTASNTADNVEVTPRRFKGRKAEKDQEIQNVLSGTWGDISFRRNNLLPM